jgi:hypothetical protein
LKYKEKWDSGFKKAIKSNKNIWSVWSYTL